MIMLRRFAYFILLNLVVMLTLSLVANVFGIQPYLTRSGLNLSALFIFCLFWGMGGAFISLLLSKVMAKWSYGVKIIDPNSATFEERQLLETVRKLATLAQLPKMPDVGIYNSPEVNAFATGPTKSNSLVAVSSGILQSMDQKSLEGVLGHEITHIANGDMVTMTLLQGVVNAFVYFLAQIAAFAIDQALRGDRDDRGGGLGFMGRYLVTTVLQILLFIPGSMVISFFSRYREFRADAGGAQLAGRSNMISALRSLQKVSAINEAVPNNESSQAPAIAAFKIASSGQGRMALLFSTHPPLEERIARLESGADLGSGAGGGSNSVSGSGKHFGSGPNSSGWSR